MSKSDDRKLEALIRKNAAKAAAKAKKQDRRQFDSTLPAETEDDAERKRFFQDMKKREF